jgi:hypothetical protein
MITVQYYFATSSHETLHFVESTIDVQEGMPIDVMFRLFECNVRFVCGNKFLMQQTQLLVKLGIKNPN